MRRVGGALVGITWKFSNKKGRYVAVLALRAVGITGAGGVVFFDHIAQNWKARL